MKKFRKIWDEKTTGFLAKVKDLPRQEGYEKFMKKFPDSEVSFTAFKYQMSRSGLAPHLAHGSTKSKPLYSEQIKKGYVKIKVAQPNIWMMKSKWVYQETHPGEDLTERSNYIFLDGNNRNFDPKNIERVPLYLMGIFANEGGCIKGQPELTKLNVLKAKLKWASFNAAEKVGLTVKQGRFRKWKEKYIASYTRANAKRKKDRGAKAK